MAPDDTKCPVPVAPLLLSSVGDVKFDPALVTATLLFVWVGAALYKHVEKRAIANRWDRVSQQVVKERDNATHEVLKPVASAANESSASVGERQQARDAEDKRIARLKGTELLEAMRAGEISSARVVAAFSRRAHAIGHLKTRSVTQEFYDEAMETAAKVDARLAKVNSKESNGHDADFLPSLLGLPISIKDVAKMKGAVSTSVGAQQLLSSSGLKDVVREECVAAPELRPSGVGLEIEIENYPSPYGLLVTHLK